MRIGLLGCGSIGRRHLQNLLALGHSDVTIWDVDAGTRSDAARFGMPVAGSLAELWDRHPEAVLISTPSDSHVSLATEAARRGCHLFVEKPLSHSMDGVQQLIDLASERRLTTMVGCNMRFHPGPMTLKRCVESRAVGQVLAIRLQSGSFLPRWRPSQDYRRSYSASSLHGGIILDGIHELDLALWYHGPATLAAVVHTPASSLGLETDGLAEMTLRYDSGAVGSVHLNFVQRDYRRTCQVIGTDGTLYWDFTDGGVRVFGPAGDLVETYQQPDGWNINQMYVDEMIHFIEAVETGQETMNPLASAILPLALALEARQWQVAQ